jgi:hypothetical protein
LRYATRPQLRIECGFSQDVGLSANHVEKVQANVLLVYVMSIDGSKSETGPMRNFPGNKWSMVLLICRVILYTLVRAQYGGRKVHVMLHELKLLGYNRPCACSRDAPPDFRSSARLQSTKYGRS